MMLPRGSVVAQTAPTVICQNVTNMRTPLMRQRAMHKMDAKRKRVIWHKIGRWPRIAYLPQALA